MKYLLHLLSQAILCLVFTLFAHRAIAQVIWAKVTTGYNHTVALKSDGTVWAWGDNGSGQLGNGTTTNSRYPMQVAGPAGNGYLTGITAVAAGWSYSVALKSDGTVWAWGANFFGQLGDSTLIDRYTPIQVTAGVSGQGFITGVTAIAAGAYHTIALKSDSTVWDWGYNANGQLGYIITDDKNYPVPVIIAPGFERLKNIIAVAAGVEHTIALRSDGTVWAWGYNGYGQLGINTTDVSTRAVAVVGEGGNGFLTNVTAVAAGRDHTVVLKSTGEVFTWGGNTSGQLGNNEPAVSHYTTNPVQVKGVGGNGTLIHIHSIAAGYYHTVALDSAGEVYAWGLNLSGQLGDGTSYQRTTPVHLTANTSGTVAIISGCNAYHSALLHSGQADIFLTGSNGSGQLGNGSTSNRNLYAKNECGNYNLPTATALYNNQTLPAAGSPFRIQSACIITSTIIPNGSNPTSGNVTAKVWIDASEPIVGSNLYIRRHVEITPDNNATTATGQVTLYALQSEFNSYNSNSTAALPAGPVDAVGISHLRIYKYGGTSSNGSGLPNTYTGSPVIIDPADADITWNNTNGYWEISFNVTGFSGFFIGAANATILPVKLSDFTVGKQGNNSLLTWRVAQEDNIATYTIERSNDGRSFTTIGSVASLGNTTIARNYGYTDISVLKGANYYRLKVMEKDGKASYSGVRLLNFGAQISIALYPNPTKDKAIVTGVEAGMSICLTDATGKVLQVQKATGTTESLLLTSFSKGLYIVQLYGTIGQLLSSARIIKE